MQSISIYYLLFFSKSYQLALMSLFQNHQASPASDLLGKISFDFKLGQNMSQITLIFNSRQYHLSKSIHPDIDPKLLKQLLQQKSFIIIHWNSEQIKISVGILSLTFSSHPQNILNSSIHQKSIISQIDSPEKNKTKKQKQLQKTVFKLQQEVKKCLDELGQVVESLEKVQKQNQILKKQNQTLKQKEKQINVLKQGMNRLQQSFRQSQSAKNEKNDDFRMKKQIEFLKSENQNLRKKIEEKQRQIKSLLGQDHQFDIYPREKIKKLETQNSRLVFIQKQNQAKIKSLENFLEEIIISKQSENHFKQQPTFESQKIVPPQKNNNIKKFGMYKRFQSGNKTNHKLSWDTNFCKGLVDYANSDTLVFLRESIYRFRSVVGNVGFFSGIHYWEILLDDRTAYEIKIGVTLSKNFDVDSSSFSDYEFGFAFYCNGSLRHKSNREGAKYGRKVLNKDTIGVFLNMQQGTLAFSINEKCYGAAFRDESLKKGPIYPAVALLHVGGCTILGQLQVPELFYHLI